MYEYMTTWYDVTNMTFDDVTTTITFGALLASWAMVLYMLVGDEAWSMVNGAPAMLAAPEIIEEVSNMPIISESALNKVVDMNAEYSSLQAAKNALFSKGINGGMRKEDINAGYEWLQSNYGSSKSGWWILNKLSEAISAAIQYTPGG